MTENINYEENYDVFLSYRRDGGETMAILLRDRLVSKGYRVFLDVENLRSGDFNEKLLQIIENCTDFIIVLSQNSLERCVNETDWVRKEIIHALKHNRNIVPMILRGFEWPQSLPAEMTVLPNYNGVNATSNEFFDAAIDRLAERFLKSKKRTEIKDKPVKEINANVSKLMKKAASIIKLLSLVLCILFFFPMFTISCSGVSVSLSGFDSFIGKTVSVMGVSEKVDGDIGAVFLLLIPLAMLLIFFMKKTLKDKVFLLAAALSVAGIIALNVFSFAVRQKAEEQLSTVRFEWAYYFSIVIYILSAVISGLYFYFLSFRKDSFKLPDDKIVPDE